MRNSITLALAAIAVLASCAKQGNETPESNLQQVTLNFSPYVMEPMTKAVQNIANLSNFLDIWVIDGETVTPIHQIKEEGVTFGTVTLSLDKTKTYTIHAVAHKGNGEANLENDVISFANDKITDPFFYTTTFSPGSTTELSCVMNRISGQFKLETSDAVPDEVTKFRFTITGSGKQWNVGGYTEGASERVIVVNLSSRNNDGSATFNVYVMAENMTATTNVDICVEALDANDEVIQMRNLTGVSIKDGYRTTYRGVFFIGVDVEAGFSAEGEWNLFDVEAY